MAEGDLALDLFFGGLGMTTNTLALRRSLRTQRQALSLTQQTRASQMCIEALKKFILTHQPTVKNIALYYPIQGEIDLLGLPKLIAQNFPSKINFFLPVLNHPKEPLSFGRYESLKDLKRNRLGILEPETSPLTPQQLDFVCVPLVAFDAERHRVGMGGGYYDRTFAFRAQSASTPFLMGIGYAFQEIPVFTPNPWDITMDGILTERGLYGSMSF